MRTYTHITQVLVCALLGMFLLTSCKPSDFFTSEKRSANERPFAIETMKKIITALDEEDSEALFALFSEAAKENYDLESQIEEAMEYYKGKSLITCEDVNQFFTGSSGTKDGAYYYKSIRFLLYDWKTDAGETYSFDVVYVLTEEEDPAQIGLSKILFKDPATNNGYVLAIGAKLE
ncbi:MAG: DUF5104 domain-containing protein [Lachnospiraceae bacterium]|nr:DUF5104 domain-containing protein [Lachnospiraceae bacterium]